MTGGLRLGETVHDYAARVLRYRVAFGEIARAEAVRTRMEAPDCEAWADERAALREIRRLLAYADYVSGATRTSCLALADDAIGEVPPARRPRVGDTCPHCGDAKLARLVANRDGPDRPIGVACPDCLRAWKHEEDGEVPR